MIILVGSKIDQSTIQASLGKPEYSYFFLLKDFLPALEQIGEVIAVKNSEEVIALTSRYRAVNETVVFLSFSPPHQVPLGLPCPTVAVFAWEFDSLPSLTAAAPEGSTQDGWGGDPRNDWGYVFERIAGAIATSREAAQLVERSMDEQFPVIALPAPVWARYASVSPISGWLPDLGQRVFDFAGQVIDSQKLELKVDEVAHKPVSEAKRIRKALLHGWWHEVRLPKGGADTAWQPTATTEPQPELVTVEGVVYTTVLNPNDGRKNWVDLVSAFCWAFKDVADATLVVKMTHHDIEHYRMVLLTLLARLSPFRCRVLVVHGFLPDAEYLQLINATTYYVNASSGEGLCLPLMESLCCGKPAIAPAHTAMSDYLRDDFAFLVRTSREPSCWPHDPTGMLSTHSHRLSWQSLMEAYRASYRTAKHDSSYQAMSKMARSSMQEFCSLERVSRELGDFLQKVAAVAAMTSDLPDEKELLG